MHKLRNREQVYVKESLEDIKGCNFVEESGSKERQITRIVFGLSLGGEIIQSHSPGTIIRWLSFDD